MAAAIYAVNIRKYNHSLLGLAALLLAVSGTLLSLGFGTVTVVYAIISGTVLLILMRLTKTRDYSISDSSRLEFHPRSFLNLIVSMLVFAGCLFLISHTKVWQYRTASPDAAVIEAPSSLIGINLILVILPGLFLVVLAPLVFKKLKEKES